MSPVPLLLLAALPPVFADGLRYTMDGLHPRPVVVTGEGRSSQLAWLLPAPTPTPADIAPVMNYAMEQNAPGGRSVESDPTCGTPDDFQPDTTHWLILPVALDIRDWSYPRNKPFYNWMPTDPAKWNYFPDDSPELLFNYLHDGISAVNDVLAEAGLRVQVMHINLHSAEYDDPASPTTTQAAAWWTPEHRHFYAQGGLVWMIDGFASDTGWWSDWGSCGGTIQTGADWFHHPTTPLSNGPTNEDWTHELLHAFGLPHPDCCTPPLNFCTSGCYTGPLVCPSEDQLTADSYCGDLGCSVYDWNRQQFTAPFVRLARYKQEPQACYLRLADTWPTPRVPQCSAPMPADGSAVALLLPVVGLVAFRPPRSRQKCPPRRIRAPRSDDRGVSRARAA